LSENEALVFLYELCEGIAILQQEEFVHGDISPGNILLTDRFQDDNNFKYVNGIHRKITVKLIDFDITKVVQDSDHTVTSAVGTLPYAAPEILDFKNPTDRADIYSLGCIFCFMLTGKSPKDSGWKELLGDYSEEAYRIFEICTASYELRYSSISKLKKDIRRLLCYPDNYFCNVLRQIPGFRSRNPIKMVLFIHSFFVYCIGISLYEEEVSQPELFYVFCMVFYVIFIIIWFDVFHVGREFPGYQQAKRILPVIAPTIKFLLTVFVGYIFSLIYLT